VQQPLGSLLGYQLILSEWLIVNLIVKLYYMCMVVLVKIKQLLNFCCSNSKISVCVSILYTLCRKGIIPVPLPYLCLATYLLLSVIQVSLFWTGGRDPFIAIENAVSPYCFGSPLLEANSSSQSKKKSKKE
jgi:hypothetical protein